MWFLHFGETCWQFFICHSIKRKGSLAPQETGGPLPLGILWTWAHVRTPREEKVLFLHAAGRSGNQVPLLCWGLISLSKPIPSLVPNPIPLGIEEYQTKGDWTPAGLCGVLSCPLFFLGLRWVPKSRGKPLLIREVRACRNHGKTVKQGK